MAVREYNIDREHQAHQTTENTQIDCFNFVYYTDLVRGSVQMVCRTVAHRIKTDRRKWLTKCDISVDIRENIVTAEKEISKFDSDLCEENPNLKWKIEPIFTTCGFNTRRR